MGELTFSLSAVPKHSLFVKLHDLPKTWRHQFFIVEHPMDFIDVQRQRAEECSRVPRPTRFSGEEANVIKALYKRSIMENISTVTFS